MLDAMESKVFDEELRQDPGLRRACQEMDRLCAAIAASSVDPVVPGAGRLGDLQRRLGLVKGGRRCRLWVGVSGWLMAAALAVFSAWRGAGPWDGGDPEVSGPAAAPAAPVMDAAREEASMEAMRLHEEIRFLRGSLEEFHQRDGVMFQLLPGRALTLVMIMLPPGENAEGQPSLTAVLGDALAAANAYVPAWVEEDPGESGIVAEAVPDDEARVPAMAMAVPIYDAARDAGTLVVSDLEPAGKGNAYHLWVLTRVGGKPVHVGSLPESSALGTDTFDFSLGSSMVVPAGFLLTHGPSESPVAPSGENTVLQGPPSSFTR
jgi:hypothetical protein